MNYAILSPPERRPVVFGLVALFLLLPFASEACLDLKHAWLLPLPNGSHFGIVEWSYPPETGVSSDTGSLTAFVLGRRSYGIPASLAGLLIVICGGLSAVFLLWARSFSSRKERCKLPPGNPFQQGSQWTTQR